MAKIKLKSDMENSQWLALANELSFVFFSRRWLFAKKVTILCALSSEIEGDGVASSKYRRVSNDIGTPLHETVSMNESSNGGPPI